MVDKANKIKKPRLQSKLANNKRSITGLPTPPPSESSPPPYALTCLQQYETQAACHFMHNFISVDSERTRGDFDYFQGLSNTGNPLDAALNDVVVSLGMLGIGRMKSGSGLNVMARMKYCSALHSIQEALQDADRARNDQTLITVLLLSIYEVSAGIEHFRRSLSNKICRSAYAKNQNSCTEPPNIYSVLPSSY